MRRAGEGVDWDHRIGTGSNWPDREMIVWRMDLAKLGFWERRLWRVARKGSNWPKKRWLMVTLERSSVSLSSISEKIVKVDEKLGL